MLVERRVLLPLLRVMAKHATTAFSAPGRTCSIHTTSPEASHLAFDPVPSRGPHADVASASDIGSARISGSTVNVLIETEDGFVMSQRASDVTHNQQFDLSRAADRSFVTPSPPGPVCGWRSPDVTPTSACGPPIPDSQSQRPRCSPPSMASKCSPRPGTPRPPPPRPRVQLVPAGKPSAGTL